MALVTLNKINTNLFEDYTKQDLNLIPAFDVISQFNPETDNIEFSIYNELNQLEYIDYSYKNYTVTLDYNTQQNAVSTVNVDPEIDTIKAGYDQGNYTVVYNFFRNQLSSSLDSPFYLKQISSDRTELRLANNDISNDELEKLVNEFKTELTNSAYFEDFQINLGNNNIFIANNILLDTVSYSQYTVLIKLYEPLEPQFLEKDTLWVTLQTASEVSFNINFPPRIVEPEKSKKLRGPNFEVQLKDVVNNSTPYKNLTSLTTTILTSSYNELQNILAQKGITVNVDYSDFNNFVYFSSAEERVRNFYYKVSLIEEYQNEINNLNSLSPTDNSSSILLLEKQIENTIKNFDKYEYYQYYSSGSSDGLSNIYPKTNSVPPYILTSTSSFFSQLWLTTQTTSGSNYDIENSDRLVNNLPSFVKDDDTNASFFLFLDMIGQHFDNMWVYTKDVSNRFDTDNRLNYGISKDIVANAIQSMGVNLYQNNFSSDDLYSALLGINGSGSLLPPTGSELITDYVYYSDYNYRGFVESSSLYYKNDVFTYISQNFIVNYDYFISPPGTPTSSVYLSDLLAQGPPAIAFFTGSIPNISPPLIKLDDLNKETYKRIYHNLPYLLKKKGTVEGLRALINIFGIPDTILRISEFGGKDKDNTNDWDYFQNKSNYTFYISSSFTSSLIDIPWSVNNLWNSPNNKPQTLSFRFKPNSLPPSNQFQILAHLDADLFSPINTGYITLTYTGSGYSSASYSGSIPSSSNQYATLTYWSSGSTLGTSSVVSIDAPFYDGNWWSISLSSGSTYTLKAANKIYNGNNGFKIGYTASNSTTNLSTAWSESILLYIPFISASGLPNPVRFGGNIYTSFIGSYQELRYYNVELGENEFYDLVMNPYSIEGSNYSSSANNLIFRAPLGSDLITTTGTRTSIHPKVTGSFITNSFSTDSNYTINTRSIFYPQTEFIYYDQPTVGIKNRISQKIRIEDNLLPTGDVLTPYRTIQQRYPQSESYIRDVNYIEVAFSPQNEINDDINSSMGYFNIGEYIGDPRQVSESSYSYPDLDRLRNSYFDKYYKNYNWNDYIRLIKYFDNSLFKMIKDFTPAKSGLSTGVVIKQHLLERNRQRPAQVEISQHYYSGSIYSQQMWDPITSGTYISNSRISKINGGAGGVLNDYSDLPLPPSSLSGSRSILGPIPTSFTNLFSGSNYLTSDGIFYTDPSQGTISLHSGIVSKYNPPLTFGHEISIGGANYLLSASLSSSLRGEIENLNVTTLSSNNNYIFKFSTVFPLENEVFEVLTKIDGGNILYTSLYCLSSYNPSSSVDILAGAIVYSYPYITPKPSNPLENYQIWDETILTPSGSTTLTHKTEDEFYNGELKGTEIKATNGELNDWNNSKFPSTLEIEYTPYLYSSDITSYTRFVQDSIFPGAGEIYLWYDTGSTEGASSTGGGGGGTPPVIPGGR